MENLTIEDFQKLNNDYIYVAKRKFDVDIDNDITSSYISDVLISLYFEGQRTKSRIAISLVGSYTGQTVIKQWGGKWVPESLSIKYVGPNNITINPFSIAHQRLTKGINKSLFNQLEMVSIKSGYDDIENLLEHNKIEVVFNKLFEEGWWPISYIYKTNLPNYVKYEMAYVLGLMAKYLENKEYVKQKFSELIENKETIYYACVAFQNCLFSDFVDKVIEIIKDNSFSNNIKVQAISALRGWSKEDELKVMNFARELLFKLEDPILKFYTGNLLGTFDNPENIEWINQQLQKDYDEFTLLALLVAVQLLRKKEFYKTLISIFFNDNSPSSVKDEVIKTLYLLPINEEIKEIREKYDSFDMKNKINFVNMVLFSSFSNKKEF
ncbi:MAG: hypothetical protein ACK4GR_03740, partial [bacterium]